MHFIPVQGDPVDTGGHVGHGGFPMDQLCFWNFENRDSVI